MIPQTITESPFQSQLPLIPPGMDNRIFNGDFLIDQVLEGTSTTPSGTGTQQLFDGWTASLSQASKLKFQRNNTGLGNFTNLITVTVVSTATMAATDKFYLLQSIEGPNMMDFAYGTANANNVIVSFLAQASVTGTYCCGLFNTVGGNQTYTASYSLVANQLTQVNLSIPGDITGTWSPAVGASTLRLFFDLGSGSNFQGTAGIWNNGGSSITSTAAAVQLVTNGSATFSITNVRLYPGSVVLPYQPRPYQVEKEICYRYYQKTFPDGTAPAQNAGVAGAITVKNPIALGDPSEWWQFVPKMAKTPSITTFNPSATNANWRDITASSDATVSVDPATTIGSSGVLIATSGTVTTLGDVLAIHAIADARL